MQRFIKIATLAVLSTTASAVNECKQYLTCPECLGLNNTVSLYTDPSNVGRPDCGWCHVPITYEDGHEGAKCADVRDDPWNCGDQYDTATCTPGWACDRTSNKCIMANPGDGFGSKSTCENYCQGPTPPGGDTYRCNTTSYECEKCKDGDEGCQTDRAQACDNCKNGPDPTQLFKCNKTDPEQPKCDMCPKGNSTAGCAPRGTACKSCAPKQKLFECDEKTLTCVVAKDQGNIKEACTAACGHITPQELLGTWRGLMAKEGEAQNFDMGEFDLVFGDKNLTVKYPNRTQDVFDVATTGGSTLILQKAGHEIKVVHNVLAYLKHTQAAGLSTYGWDKDAPDSFRQGMQSNKAADFVMWKCNTWGGSDTCKFSNKTKEEIASTDLPQPTEVAVVTEGDGPNDECNSFGDCHTCIGEHQGVRCGWCLGGTLSYRGVGKTVFKCGGFKAGTPFNFTCPADFRTTDCKGYSCDFATQKCAESNDGQFPDALSCHDVCSKDIQNAKCNLETQKCDKCSLDDKDCNTAAFCAATCGKPHGKCDPGTGQCKECTPGKDDPSCTQVKEACDQECTKQSLSKCNPKGTCDKCEDGSDIGCVNTAACEATCQPHPDPHNDKYRCSWNGTHPTCVSDKQGEQSKTECEQQCQEPSFAKCNFKNNTCEKCDHDKDKDCLQTAAFCKIAQQEGRCKAQELNGLYRMIEVNPGYDVGEFDVMFKDGKMLMQEFVDKIEAKDLGTVSPTGSAEGGGVTFEVKDWKPEPKIWGKDKLFGVYKTSFGEDNIFMFIEMAFADHAIKTLDEGLKGRYFVGVACKEGKTANDEKICDFTKATPKEQKTSTYAKFKFLMG